VRVLVAGLKLNQFFGNFFVRSTDLLAMPNINPDSAIGVTVDYDESMADGANACFQAALLYTSSRGACLYGRRRRRAGDRRIRVHTLCLPVTSRISTIHNGVDPEAVISMLAKVRACVHEHRQRADGRRAGDEHGHAGAALGREGGDGERVHRRDRQLQPQLAHHAHGRRRGSPRPANSAATSAALRARLDEER